MNGQRNGEKAASSLSKKVGDILKKTQFISTSKPFLEFSKLSKLS